MWEPTNDDWTKKSRWLFRLLEIDLNKLDYWGIHKRQGSLGAVDFQHDPNRMQVDIVKKGSGSRQTSPALAMQGHKVDAMMEEVEQELATEVVLK